MKNRYYILLICAVFIFLLVGKVHATAKDYKCKQGYRQIDSLIYSILFKKTLTNDDDEIKKFNDEMEECLKKATSYSPKKRQEFKELIDTLISRVDVGIISLFSTPPEGNNLQIKLGTLKNVKEKLQISSNRLANKLPLDRGWGRDFITNFYIGYEGSSVSGIKEKEIPRIGFMVYSQILGKLEEVKNYGIHIFGNILTTSSAEQTEEDPNNDDTVEETIELDFNLYVPIALKQQSVGLVALGLIGTVSTRKVDNTDNFTDKNMLGIRAAYSPEAFFDILVGKTEGIAEKRAEVRGQLPIATALNGNIFIGGVYNFRVSNKDKSNANNNDSLRLYTSWQVGFSDIFSIN